MFSPTVPNARKTRTRTASRRPDQLPAGRHGLDREYVIENQRDRILTAIAQASADLGYPKVAVEDIIKRAGVSRRTFYDHFSSKDEPFLAAYDRAADKLLTELNVAAAGAESFVEGVRDCLEAFLRVISEDPMTAHMCIVEVLAAGPEALERRNATMRAIAELIDEGAKRDPTTRKAPRLVSETIVGGIYEVVYARVLRREFDAIPDLLPDLTYSALLPYVGGEIAQQEFQRQKRRRQRIRAAAARRED
jgi:AcrR family transcriptional regulator